MEVRLPASGRVVSSDVVATAPRRELAIQGRVLLAEDEEAVLEFERDVLAGAGAQVVTVMNSDEVRNRLRTEVFDALVISGKMPGGWGVSEVYGWLSKNCPGMEKRVLFTFSSVPEPEIRAVLQENNAASLVKPFEIAELISQARRLLQKGQAAAAG